MFTSDAAAGEHVGYLGLAGRDSARIWLAQRGIRPVGRESGPSGQNLYLAEAVMSLQGRGRRRRPAYDPWRDAAGVSIPPGARVEQVLVDRPHGALASRLGKQGEVIRRSRASRLVVRFDGETQPVGIRPDLVRVRPVSTEQIIGQLEQLRDLVGDGDGR
jgi:hypothetical protein